jgi:hypothetical protein
MMPSTHPSSPLAGHQLFFLWVIKAACGLLAWQQLPGPHPARRPPLLHALPSAPAPCACTRPSSLQACIIRIPQRVQVQSQNTPFIDSRWNAGMPAVFKHMS